MGRGTPGFSPWVAWPSARREVPSVYNPFSINLGIVLVHALVLSCPRLLD